MDGDSSEEDEEPALAAAPVVEDGEVAAGGAGKGACAGADQCKHYETGYNKGFDKGADTGHDKGFSKGWHKGYDKGYGRGYDADAGKISFEAACCSVKRRRCDTHGD